MATTDSMATLCAGVAKLAYTVAQMAAVPLLPFMPPDVSRLLTQSNSLVGQYISLHGRSPGSLIQTAVDSASLHVSVAQHMYDVINGTPSNSLSADAVFNTTDSAISTVNAV